MKVTQAVKRVVRPFVDFPTWIGYQQLVEMSRGIGIILQRLFIPQKAEQEESFDDALRRLQISEHALKQKARSLNYLTFLWFAIGIIVIIYGFYLVGAGSWHGFIACVAITSIAFTQSFRCNFWLFQIRQRRLGVSFKEWLNASFVGGENKS